MATYQGILDNGNGFDVQMTLGTETVLSGVTTYSSQSLDVINGMNIGAPTTSGVTITYLIPASMDEQTKNFTVISKAAANTSVVVSGTSPVTINGATAAITIANLVGKNFFAVPSTSGTTNNWYSY
jgi:hypothetical protein